MVDLPGAGPAHEDPLLGAGGEIDVVRVAPRLADELQRRRALGSGAGKRRALLKEDHRVGAVQPLGEFRRLLERVVIDIHLVALEPRIALERAEDILIVVEYRDPHSFPSPIERAILYG